MRMLESRLRSLATIVLCMSKARKLPHCQTMSSPKCISEEQNHSDFLEALYYSPIACVEDRKLQNLRVAATSLDLPAATCLPPHLKLMSSPHGLPGPNWSVHITRSEETSLVDPVYSGSACKIPLAMSRAQVYAASLQTCR